MNKTKRLFFATHIVSPLIHTHLLPHLKKALDGESISWTKPEQLHITLRFLGDTHENLIPDIERAFAKALDDTQPFDINLCKVKMFGSRYKPTVLWIGAEDNGQMKKLFFQIEQQLKKLGIHGDRQNFISHLTLCRIKRLKDLKNFQKTIEQYSEFQAETTIVDTFTLFESRLEKSGAVHIPLRKFLLKTK